MMISSSAFGNNETIPKKYTCDGEEVNPPLELKDIPEGTQSLVLIMDDPDSPSGVWTHWTVWNISPETSKIEEGTLPVGAVEGKTSFGQPGYGGPCPPSGTHRYFFKLYALDIALDLPETADVEELENSMVGHVIGESELVGLFSRG